MIEIDVRLVEAEYLALTTASMQQQAQRRKAKDVFGLLAD